MLLEGVELLECRIFLPVMSQSRLLVILLALVVFQVALVQPQGVEDLLADGSFEDMFGELQEAIGKLQNFGACSYKCEAGESLVARGDYEPTHNGCGSYGIELVIEEMPAITDCCNKHDECYDVCGANRTECDLELRQCVGDVCAEANMDENLKNKEQYDIKGGLEVCITMAQLFYQTTALLGCDPYLKAQKKSCKCVKDEL